MSTARHLLDTNRGLWRRLATHPFVQQTADGTLPDEAFRRWLAQDHAFVVSFRRFLGRLVDLAPDETAGDLLGRSFAPLEVELDLFRREAAARGVDLAAEPAPTTLGYTGYLMAAPSDGWPVAVTVLYGAEKAYLDAWLAVRERAPDDSPYRRFVDNWSSPSFAAWVNDLASLLDRTVPQPTPPVERAFARVVRFELRFWDAVHAGETW